jgi:hypothetical protein
VLQRLLISAALAAVTFVAAVTDVARAQGSSPPAATLVARDDRDLALGSTARVKTAAVCNVGRQPVTRAGATLTGFGFTRTAGDRKVPVSDRTVVTTSQPALPIDSGACRSVSLRLVDGVDIDPGTYTGVLAITSDGSGLVRLKVTVTDPSTDAAPAAAAESSALHATKRGWWGDAKLADDANVLALELPTAPQQLTLGEECQPPTEGTAWDDAKCPMLGVLFSGSSRARVSIAGPVSTAAANGVALLPLRIDGHEEVGDYEGTLTLAADTEAKAKLTVKSGLFGAVLAVLIGALIPLGIQLWKGMVSPRLAFRTRRKEIATSYRSGSVIGCGLAEDHGEFYPPSSPDVGTHNRKVLDAIKAYARTTVVFDVSNDSYKKIDASLRLAENDAAYIWSSTEEPSSFCEALTTLDAKLKQLAELLETELRSFDSPALGATGASLLKGKMLEVGEATKRGTMARAHCELIDAWIELARTSQRYNGWLDALEARRDQEGVDPMTPDDVKLLSTARAKHGEVHTELTSANDAKALAKLGVAADVDALYSMLIYLGSRYGIPMPEVSASIDVQEDAALKAQTRLERWIRGARDPAVIPANSVVLLKTTRWIGDLLVFVVSLAAAVVAGLSGFYFDDTWGSAEDYLVVIAVATVTAGVTKALLDGLTTLWVRQAPPTPTTEEPSGATVKVAETSPA